MKPETVVCAVLMPFAGYGAACIVFQLMGKLTLVFGYLPIGRRAWR